MHGACIPGCGDRPSLRGRAWKPTAPAVRIRGRCDTDTNFDCNQLHLTPSCSPAASASRVTFGNLVSLDATDYLDARDDP
jgi:hypothetical protein